MGFTLLTFVLVQCSSSDDVPVDDTDDTVTTDDDGGDGSGGDGNGDDGNGGNDDPGALAFSITVNGGRFQTTEEAHLYISDENGMILASEALENNTTTQIDIPDGETLRYDATIRTKAPFGDGFIYFMHTYEGVSSDQITINVPPFNGQDLFFEITNTGC